MNIGWRLASLLIIMSLLVSVASIHPHHLGFRLKPHNTSNSGESKPRPTEAAAKKTEESKSRSTNIAVKTRNPGVMYCFASHCDVKCTTKCIGISKATGRTVPISVLSGTKAKKSMFLEEEKRSSAFITMRSLLKLATRSLLKKIPLTALVRLAIREERYLGKQKKITRVQWGEPWKGGLAPKDLETWFWVA